MMPRSALIMMSCCRCFQVRRALTRAVTVGIMIWADLGIMIWAACKGAGFIARANCRPKRGSVCRSACIVINCVELQPCVGVLMRISMLCHAAFGTCCGVPIGAELASHSLVTLLQ